MVKKIKNRGGEDPEQSMIAQLQEKGKNASSVDEQKVIESEILNLQKEAAAPAPAPTPAPTPAPAQVEVKSDEMQSTDGGQKDIDDFGSRNSSLGGKKNKSRKSKKSSRRRSAKGGHKSKKAARKSVKKSRKSRK